MIIDTHSEKISIPITTTSSGDNTIITAQTDAWIYIHEVIGDLSADGIVTIKAGSRVLGVFDLSAGQGLVENDEPGNDGVPRFKCKPGEAFILNISNSSVFKGSCDYSLKY